MELGYLSSIKSSKNLRRVFRLKQQQQSASLPQLPSALGAPEIHQTCQELFKRHGNKPERNYQELPLGTPVWVQHRQNATWKLATVVNQCAPNSYWIMQENGAEQPEVYRHTRTMLKIRSTPTEGEQTTQMKEWSTETRSIESNIPAIPYGTRDCVIENSQKYASSNTVQLPLARLDLPASDFFRKQGGKPGCRTIVYRWYYTGKYT